MYHNWKRGGYLNRVATYDRSKVEYEPVSGFMQFSASEAQQEANVVMQHSL